MCEHAILETCDVHNIGEAQNVQTVIARKFTLFSGKQGGHPCDAIIQHYMKFNDKILQNPHTNKCSFSVCIPVLVTKLIQI